MVRQDNNNLVVGAAVGSGISVLPAEEGGADFMRAIDAAHV